MTMLAEAIEWAERGIPVFPLKPRDKVPLTEHGVKDASQDPKQIREWWEKWPNANIGGATGSSSARWVLDQDGPEGAASLAALVLQNGPIPDTMTVTTGRGKHFWFMEPWDGDRIRNSAGKVAPGLDVRGDGGYVILPPSVHPNGTVYKLERELQPVDAPPWLLAKARKPSKPVPVPVAAGQIPMPSGSSNERDRVLGIARAAAERIRSAPEGTRNQTVNDECFNVGGYLASGKATVDDVASILEEAAAQADQPLDMVRRVLGEGRNKPKDLPPDRPQERQQGPRVEPQPEQDWADEVTDPDIGPDIAALAKLEHTDLGNAWRFDMRFGDDVRWCDPRQSWIVWNGIHWEWDGKRQVHRWAQNTVECIADEVKFIEAELATFPAPENCSQQELERRKRVEARFKAAAAHAKASQSTGKISAVATEARGLPRRAVDVADLDKDPWLLVTRNHSIDLKEGTARPHNRKDLVTRALAVEYDPHAEAPNWERFLEQALPSPDVRAMVQRAIGYALTGDISLQVWFLFTGSGSNGKSTLLETIRWLLGKYATTLPAAFLEQRPYEQHATELVDLCGARLAIGSEPQSEGRWDSERIKRLTGGEVVKARGMRQDFFEFDPTAKLFGSANRLPRTTDTSWGFWRRIVLVPFDVQFTGSQVDPDLPQKLRAEGSGILNWALEGLEALRAGGMNLAALDVPAACKVAAAEYQKEQDSVSRFVAERCIVEEGERDKSSALYAAYKAWHAEQGYADRPVSNVAFGKSLGRIPKVLAYDGAHKTRMWTGIRLVETQSSTSHGGGWNNDDQH